MVATRRILIADRVTRVSSDLRPNLEHDTRRELTSAVLSGKPIGGERDFLV